MIALDAGILAWAVNRYAPEHPRAVRVVELLVNGDTPWALPWPAVEEFLALVTHPHAVARPLAAADALGFVELVLASPAVRPLGPTSRHAATLREVLAAHVGPGLPVGLDLAVVLREHGVHELLSTDPAMRRFPFLAVRNPLVGEPWTPGQAPARRYRRLKTAGRRATADD